MAVVGGYLFGPVAGTLYTMIGVTIGSVVAFLLARWYGRSIVGRLPAAAVAVLAGEGVATGQYVDAALAGEGVATGQYVDAALWLGTLTAVSVYTYYYRETILNHLRTYRSAT